MFGAEGFEPPAYWSQTSRANQAALCPEKGINLPNQLVFLNQFLSKFGLKISCHGRGIVPFSKKRRKKTHDSVPAIFQCSKTQTVL